MKFALVVLFACFAVAQEKIAEPDFPDTFYHLDAGNLVQLEKAGTTLKAHGSITGKGSAYYEIPGAKSSARLHSVTLEFVVKLPADVDPSQWYSIRKLEVQKDKRRVPSVTIRGGLFSGNVSVQQTGEINGQWSRYGEHSAKVLMEHLPPGEYAFQKAGAMVVFCFGVD